MRPLLFDYPDHPEFAGRSEEFLFGRDLLVAPVLIAGATQRELILPPGTWYEFATGRPLAGGARVTVDAPLNSLPLFVREGAILPLRHVVQHTGERPINPLTLAVFPLTGSGRSTSTYYEDDGLTFRYQSGSYFRRAMHQTTDTLGLGVDIGKAEGTYVPSPRLLALEIAAQMDSPRAVSLDGIPLAAREVREFAGTGWMYDPARRMVVVRFPDGGERHEVRVHRR
jgi:alpha-glucosidase